MQLHKAIARVLKVAPKGKKGDAELYKSVCFASTGDPTTPDMVYATDGVVTTQIWVDLELPPVLLPRDVLTKVCKHEIRSVALGPTGAVHFNLVDGGHYAVTPMPSENYPLPVNVGPSDFNQFTELEHWRHIHQVLSVCGDFDVKPHLQYLRLGPDWCGGTDGARVAVVVAHGWEEHLLVPRRLLDKLPPKATVSLRTDGDLLFAIVGGEELRIVPKPQDPTFPDLLGYLGVTYQGASMAVSLEALESCIKRATQVSPVGAVSCQLGGTGLLLSSWAQDEVNAEYEATLVPDAGSFQSGESVKLVLDGKMLLEMLKLLSTPNVRLSYVGPEKALRLESGAFIGCIMPWSI